MAKKDKKKIEETTIENYYDLKVDKIDELVAALKDDSVPEEEVNFGMNTSMGLNDPKNYRRRGEEKQFDPYKTDFLSRVPVWLKALFVKFWFGGAVCFFIVFGTGLQDIDLILVTGVVLGMVVDILVNPLFRFMETDGHDFDAYMMFPFPFKAIWTFFSNLIYYVLIVYLVNYGYFGINELMNLINGTQDVYYLGVEPLTFGLFVFAADMIFIGIKDGIVALVRHAKKKKEGALNV